MEDNDKNPENPPVAEDAYDPDAAPNADWYAGYLQRRDATDKPQASPEEGTPV